MYVIMANYFDFRGAESISVGGGLRSGVLTRYGILQTVELGRVLRRQYVETGFISPNFNGGRSRIIFLCIGGVVSDICPR